MIEVDFNAGSSIDEAMHRLFKVSSDTGEAACGNFNGKILYSTDSIDDAYKKLTGHTKAKHEAIEKAWHAKYERELSEHESKIPTLAKKYMEEARGLVLDSELSHWDEIVLIRLHDLYRGMELQQVLDICKVMRNESSDYDKRLRTAYRLFMDAGHSGLSAGLTASMIRCFCPYGNDVADAVMDFRFDKEN